MATSSITHNFIISDSVAAERFANALEEAEKNKVDLKPTMGRFLTDPEEITELLKKVKANLNEQKV